MRINRTTTRTMAESTRNGRGGQTKKFRKLIKQALSRMPWQLAISGRSSKIGWPFL
jgi:hypothetical protein